MLLRAAGCGVDVTSRNDLIARARELVDGDLQVSHFLLEEIRACAEPRNIPFPTSPFLSAWQTHAEQAWQVAAAALFLHTTDVRERAKTMFQDSLYTDSLNNPPAPSTTSTTSQAPPASATSGNRNTSKAHLAATNNGGNTASVPRTNPRAAIRYDAPSSFDCSDPPTTWAPTPSTSGNSNNLAATRGARPKSYRRSRSHSSSSEEDATRSRYEREERHRRRTGRPY